MADACGKLVGAGAVQFRCREDQGHDGPCAATEIGPSVIAREKWLRTEGTDSTPPPASSPEPQDGSIFLSHEDRLTQAQRSLRAERSELPAVIQSWLTGAAAQLALIELWRASQRADGPLVLTPEHVHRLVPEKLRV